MARGHQRTGTPGAFGHEGRPEAEHQVRGRDVGGKLHRAGAKNGKPKEVSPMASKAVVVHKVKTETALEARIVEALRRANLMIVANREAVADAQFARLEAIRYVPYRDAAEGVRSRLVAAGIIS